MNSSNKLTNMKYEFDCYLLQLFGVINLITAIIIIIFHSIILFNYFYDKHLNKSIINMFVLVLSMINLIFTLFELPFSVLNQLHCQWIFKPIIKTCILSGFIQNFNSYSSIYLITSISIER